MAAQQEDLTTADGRHRYAVETHRMALGLWDYVFPPWRWRKWWRQYREVKRRVALLKQAMVEAK